ncbi:MAG: TetR/AcrR family transcriptional regulator [Longimicrobiales bacterium]
MNKTKTKTPALRPSPSPSPSPSPTTADATPQALIEAGRRLFALRGFDGASVRAITSAAGANLGAITYHFGTKEEFYERVVEATVGPFADAVVSATSGASPALDRVEAVVRTYLEYLLEHGELPRFMLQGLVLRERPPEAALRHLRRIVGALVGLVREGQGSGEIRAGHPVVLGMGIISQAVHLAVTQRALAAVTGLDLSDPRTRAEVLENVTQTARRGLAAAGEVL